MQCAVASELLDMNGILFGIQLVVLLFLGPYADYGKWRPYVLICERGYSLGIDARELVTTVMLWATTLAFAGLKNPDAWAGANVLFVLGNLCECSTSLVLSLTDLAHQPLQSRMCSTTRLSLAW